MAGLRFEPPKSFQMDPLAWQTAYLTGIEGLPWFCRRTRLDSELSIERSIDESARLSLVWPTETHGPLLLSTTSLRTNSPQYDMGLELARGTINRVRCQAFEWQRLGLRLSENFLNSSANSLDSFLDAILTPTSHDNSQAVASAIEEALVANHELCRGYTEQALAARHATETRLSTLLGVQLPFQPLENLASFPIAALSNTVGIPLAWNEISSRSGKSDYVIPDAQLQWARQNSIRICAGPLISLHSASLPEWLMLVDDPFEQFLTGAIEHIKETVMRYRGKVHLWHVAAGLNTPSDLRLTDEQALRLAVHAIQTVRSLDDRAAVILSVDQPWCEYLGGYQEAVSPLHFVDALIRADLGLSGIGLEINHGYWPNGSLPRDLLEFNRLVDQWSLLGLPLMVLLRQPLSLDLDRNSNSKVGIVSKWYPYSAAETVTDSLPPIDKSRGKRRHTTPAFSNASPPAAHEVVELMLAKQAVQGILWNQLTDSGSHQYPNAGFYSASGEKRPTVDQWLQLRQQHLT